VYPTVDALGRTIFVADARRDDGKRFVVRADEKLTAFVDSNRQFGVATNWLDKLGYFSQDSTSLILRTQIIPKNPKV
jgi:hypothetical protein